MAALDDRTLAQMAARSLAYLMDERSGLDWVALQPEAKAMLYRLRDELEAAGHLELFRHSVTGAYGKW